MDKTRVAGLPLDARHTFLPYRKMIREPRPRSGTCIDCPVALEAGVLDVSSDVEVAACSPVLQGHVVQLPKLAGSVRCSQRPGLCEERPVVPRTERPRVNCAVGRPLEVLPHAHRDCHVDGAPAQRGVGDVEGVVRVLPRNPGRDPRQGGPNQDACGGPLSPVDGVVAACPVGVVDCRRLGRKVGSALIGGLWFWGDGLGAEDDDRSLLLLLRLDQPRQVYRLARSPLSASQKWILMRAHR